ncbi:hypothetical protein E1B28_008595 [Marasmius oreades]|uniref:Uncharacterized protein n=1 Tax=Marasmius oreades TaxID=181124 RepID=A0A9P7RYN1_9AGAR|nr:uncharacterized protein E1B28_008595 [Marasmius oreades]KAG7092229.1 hypothetical protein E1B28_008595 [Marasmius oreades]
MTHYPMPDVFVYPPEEDDCPPFCCFYASQAIPSNSPTQADLDAPGSALDFVSRSIHYDTPELYCKDLNSPDVRVMPRRHNPIINHREEEQCYPDNDITIRGSSPGNDSEIVEVVKVRRRSETVRSASDSTSNQPKGLKARASRAFSTLRKVSRSASRSRKSEEETVETSSRAPSPSPMPRRPSTALASLFTRSPSLRSSTSFESFNEQTIPPTPTSSAPPKISTETALSNTIHTPTSGDMHNFVPYTSDSEDDDNEDEPNVRHDDPQHTPRATRCVATPTSQSFKAGRRRFSVMNLFSSFSASEPSSSVTIVSPSVATLPLMSRDSLGPSSDSCETSSSASSTGPTTPVEETFPPLHQSRTSSGTLLKRLPSLTKKKDNRRGSLSETQFPVAAVEVITRKPRELEDIGDVSLGEMQLDSLHFSELSFDVDRF